MTDDVYIATRLRTKRQGKYHSRPDCQYLDQAHDTTSVDPEELPEGFDECLYCKGEQNPGGKGMGHIKSLKAAARQRSQD